MSTTINPQLSNILETATAASEFRTLLQAVQAAGLVDTLTGSGPFTVFAPTDEAFKSLPTGIFAGLMTDVPRLKSIISYHVVDRKIMSDELHNMTSGGRTSNLKTVQGSPIILKTQGMLQKSLYVNDAKVTKSDVVTSNGVIHIIDKVLMPTS